MIEKLHNEKKKNRRYLHKELKSTSLRKAAKKVIFLVVRLPSETHRFIVEKLCSHANQPVPTKHTGDRIG